MAALCALRKAPTWCLGRPYPRDPLPQRGTMRRRYEDDGISDDEIEGKRTFDLEEKLHTNKYNANFVTFMEGKGKYSFGLVLALWACRLCGSVPVGCL